MVLQLFNTQVQDPFQMNVQESDSKDLPYIRSMNHFFAAQKKIL